MRNVDERVKDKSSRRDEQALARIAPQHQRGHQNHCGSRGHIERGERDGLVRDRDPDGHGAHGGKQQGRPLRESQFADESFRAGRIEARQRPRKRAEGGTREDRCREQEAGRVRHGFQYTCPRMRAVDLIRVKRDGGALSAEDIRVFIALVLVPLAAACGAVVPTMSGRGLGHTGGTLDKLEAIPGFRTSLSLDEMRQALRRTGCALSGPTRDIAPADRRLYALRDVTATVESIPLICGSILSKKIAEGIGALVLDVKVGRGAFMKTEADARRLAAWLAGIAERNGVRTQALLTSMDTPLGRAVGNANEVIEAIETLKGRGPADVEALSVQLAARMLLLAGIARDLADAEGRVQRALASGAALEKFRAIIEQQGGDPRVVDDYRRLPTARHREPWAACRDGVVSNLDAELIGRAAAALGAGRDRVDAGVDHAAGIDISAPVGTAVRRGDSVLVLACDDASRRAAAQSLLAEAVQIADEAPALRPRVIDVIDGRDVKL